MAEQPVTGPGYDREHAHFHEKDLALIAKMRAELDAHHDSSSTGKLKCPRCAAQMNEVLIEQVRVDRCGKCGGIFLDKGELEILTLASSGGFFKRLFG